MVMERDSSQNHLREGKSPTLQKLVRNLLPLLVVKVDWAIQDLKVLPIGLQGNLQKELKEKNLQFGSN